VQRQTGERSLTRIIYEFICYDAKLPAILPEGSIQIGRLPHSVLTVSEDTAARLPDYKSRDENPNLTPPLASPNEDSHE